MNGSVYLVGGGEIRNGETSEIDDEIKGTASANATFVFFGAASGDSLDYIKSIRSVFESHFHVLAPTEKDGPASALSAIERASVIYLGGGTADVLIGLFKTWNLIEPLREALDRGTRLVGMSAGAQALAAWYVQEHDGAMELRRGWGLVPVCVLVHARPSSVSRAKTLWEAHQDARENTFVAIGEGTAWRIDSSGTKCVGIGEAPYVVR